MKTILFILLATGLGFLCWRFPYALRNPDDKMHLIYLVAILALFTFNKGQFKILEVIRGASVWIAVLMILLIGYSYRHQIFTNQLLSNLTPLRPTVSDDGSLMLTASNDGHFHVEALFNNQLVNCIIDTGATNIILDSNDAARIGVALDQLNFNIQTSTANGIGTVARANAATLSIGDINLSNINIYVNKEDMGSCLLGMSFLNQMHSFTIRGDQLIIQH